MKRTFYYEMMIRERHLDFIGHVNNATYLELYEEARWELLHQSNFSLQRAIEIQEIPIILAVQLDFRGELRARDEIQISTEFLEVKKKICTLKQQMIKKSDNSLASEAVFTMGVFDMKARRLLTPSEEWLKILGGTL